MTQAKIGEIIMSKDIDERKKFFQKYKVIAICGCGAYIEPDSNGCPVCGTVAAYEIIGFKK